MKIKFKNKSTVNTLTLPNALVAKLKDIYGTANASGAICNALADYFMLPDKAQELSDDTLNLVFATIEEELDTGKFAVRIPAGLYAAVIEMSKNNTISDTVAQILAHVLHMRQTNSTPAIHNSRLFYVAGNKWNNIMQAEIRKIMETSGITWEHSVETCMGGLGIFANFDFAPDKVLNDDDWNKLNLVKAIRNNPQKLIMKACSLTVDKETFDGLKNSQPSPTASVNICAAARFLYLNLNSVRKCGCSFDKKATQKKYLQRLAQIYLLHEKLQGVKIIDNDLFKILDRYRHTPNTLFIVDPPYLNTSGYEDRVTRQTPEYGKGFGLEQHQELAHLLKLIKKNNHNDFMYFCRITATRSKKQKTKESKQSVEELAEIDKKLERTIGRLYWGNGFYYTDIQTLSDGTIERIITSFNFDGATPYGCKGGQV